MDGELFDDEEIKGTDTVKGCKSFYDEAYEAMDEKTHILPEENRMSYGFEKGKAVDYNKIYETARNIRIGHLALPFELKKLMDEKMEVGKSKYGELSFQNSFANSMQVNIEEHIKDEMADMLNYLLHWHICFSFHNNKDGKIDIVELAIENVKELYEKVKRIERVK